MTRHEWHEQEGEEMIYWRANHHGGRFELYTKTGDSDHWEKLDPPPKKVLEALRDVLWRKYQRNRCPWNLVARVDKLLGKPNEGPQ